MNVWISCQSTIDYIEKKNAFAETMFPFSMIGVSGNQNNEIE